MKALALTLSLLALAGVAGCAASTADEASGDSESDVVARAQLKTGSFKLYGEAHHVPNHGCDIYTKLSINNGIAGPVATLAGGLGGFCLPAVAGPVTYNLKYKETDCGSLVFEGKNGDRSIVLHDHRTRTCRDLLQAKIIVEETVGSAPAHLLYSYDNGPVATTFSRDDRPVDGALKEITLTPTDDGKWDASLHTAAYDRVAGKPIDTVEALGSGLACAIDAAVSCKADLRPVDGALVELAITEDGTATLHTAAFDRRAGKEVDATRELATRLVRK